MYKVSAADFALQENWVGHLNAIFVLGEGIRRCQSSKAQIPSGLSGGFVEAWN